MYIWEDMIECIKLKNKFIGSINSNTLLKYNIQIPNIQRIIDDNKVCEIVLYQKSNNFFY